MRCPTFTFKNNSTGETVTINQCDYLQSRYQYLTNLTLSDWSRVGENNAGGDIGFSQSREISDIAIQIKDKRKNNPIKK